MAPFQARGNDQPYGQQSALGSLRRSFAEGRQMGTFAFVIALSAGGNLNVDWWGNCFVFFRLIMRYFAFTTKLNNWLSKEGKIPEFVVQQLPCCVWSTVTDRSMRRCIILYKQACSRCFINWRMSLLGEFICNTRDIVLNSWLALYLIILLFSDPLQWWEGGRVPESSSSARLLVLVPAPVIILRRLSPSYGSHFMHIVYPVSVK